MKKQNASFRESLKYPLDKLPYLRTTQGFLCDACLEEKGEKSKYVVMFGYVGDSKSKEMCIYCLNKLPLDKQIDILKQSRWYQKHFADCKFGTHGFYPDKGMFGLQPKVNCKTCLDPSVCKFALRQYKLTNRMIKLKEILLSWELERKGIKIQPIVKDLE